jgi:predicted ATP-grasp superfamily ATP-dependent carboligase
MNEGDKTGVVVIGGGITGLSTVRCLSGLGIPVDVILTDPGDIAHHSRFVRRHYNLFNFQFDPGVLVDLIEGGVGRWMGWSLFPTGDESLEVLSRNLDRLGSSFRVMARPWEQTRQILFKDLTYRAAKEAGVDVPDVYGYATPQECLNENIRFPVVVKPVESRRFVGIFGVKLFVANDRTELLECARKLAVVGLRAIIMDLVPGPDDRFYNYSVYIDRRGEPLAELAMRKLRKSPPFYGVCRAAETAEADCLREPTIELLHRIGWRGVANVEYKLDPRDGKYRLMEVNGRCFLMQGLAWRAGVNYPLLAWKELAAGETIKVSGNDWDGVWVNLIDDLYYGSFYQDIEKLGIRAYLRTYVRPKTHAVWSAADPAPFVFQLYREIRKAISAVVNSRYRGELHGRVQGMPVDLQ